MVWCCSGMCPSSRGRAVASEGGRKDGREEDCLNHGLRKLHVLKSFDGRDLEKISMGFLSRSLFTHLIIRYPLI